MNNILRNISTASHSSTPWLLLIMLSGYVLAGLFIFAMIAQLLILPFFNFDLAQSYAILGEPYGSNEARVPLMILQGVSSLGAFIIVPLIFIRLHLKLSISSFFAPLENWLQPFFMTVLILFCFMVANSVVIEWNQNIQLPESLSWFETYAQSKELQLEKLTLYLTSFTGLDQLFIALIVIAIIPAVGEELLFRGLIQNLFASAFKNPHVAIWLSAFLFGVFHFQFYGVIPRTLLGVLFGYLYYWSGHLSIAMMGHFVNNGLTLIMLYLSQREIIDYDPIATDTTPPSYVILLFFAVGSVLMYLFKNYFMVKEDA